VAAQNVALYTDTAVLSQELSAIRWLRSLNGRNFMQLLLGRCGVSDCGSANRPHAPTRVTP